MNSKPKIILFNGPPQSGKDFAANYLHIRFLEHFPNKPVKFASRLKQITADLLSCRVTDFEKVEFKNAKVLNGDVTNRQALIDVSTSIKKIYGKAIFGKWLAYDNKENVNSEENILISDSGFIEEFEGLTEFIDKHTRYLTPYDFHIIEIHGRGDFTNDSRGYIGSAGVESSRKKNVFKHKIYNTKSASEFLADVETCVLNILNLDIDKVN